MIKFFRSIRQKLIGEGNLKNYLFYAIGEILLVMIGILLALQVNNWNDQRKNLKEEKVILKAIHNDFVSSKKDLQHTKGALIHQKIHLVALINRCNPESPNIDVNEMDSLIRNSYALPTFDPANGTLEDILNTGRISIIQNKEIRDLLSGWQAKLEESKRQEKYQGDFLYNKFTPFIEERVEFKHKWFAKDYSEDKSFGIDSRILFNNFRFCNLLKRAHYWNYWVEKEYAVLEKDIDKIIKLTQEGK